MIWHLINDHWHQRLSARPRFQHTDYWSGNILWLRDKISAVVDWEEAGYGDPAGDVAYARIEYFLEGLPEAAETFLRVYLAETGWQLPNLPISELAASVRPMTDPAGWFTRPNMEERYRKFIKDAKRKLLNSAANRHRDNNARLPHSACKRCISSLSSTTSSAYAGSSTTLFNS